MTTAYMLRRPHVVVRLRDKSTSGVVTDAVKVKSSPEEPERPYAGADVRLIEQRTSELAWRGVSAADGTYTATGLEPGETYVPVAIDGAGVYEAVAAGPVTARRPRRV